MSLTSVRVRAFKRALFALSQTLGKATADDTTLSLRYLLLVIFAVNRLSDNDEEEDDLPVSELRARLCYHCVASTFVSTCKHASKRATREPEALSFAQCVPLAPPVATHILLISLWFGLALEKTN